MQDALDPVFAALANTTRRAILQRLIGGEATVGDLAAPFALSQPTISSHLKVLEAAGLVARGRAGNQRPVRLQPAAIAALDQWVGPFRQLWQDRLAQLEFVATDIHQQETDDADPAA